MKHISFELTMPNVGSWNGKWTGASKKYYLIKSYQNKTHVDFMDGKTSKSWYYNFGDGWGANVKAEVIDATEAAKRRKVSNGFCGYDWMVESIAKHNKIIVDQ